MTSTPIGMPVMLDMTGKAVSPAIATLPAGSYTITATYSGDGNYLTSNGTVTQTVSKASTTTGVTSSTMGTSSFGQSVTFTATVTGVNGSTPTGTVQFSYTPMGSMTSTPIGMPVTLDMTGKATVSTTALPVGTDTITATYGGDGNYSGSSGTVSQTVSKATPTVGVTSSANPSVVGISVTFTATVSGIAGSTPGGAVQFSDTPMGGTSTPLGAPVPLDGTGKASVSTSTLPVGSHTITATYNGDGNYLSRSGTTPQSVTAATVTGLTTTAPTGSGSGNSGSASNPTLNLGGRLTLTTTATYNNGTSGTPAPLMYTSSNPAVATVDASGNIAALTAGTTTITITGPNNSRTQITITVTGAAGTGLMPNPQPMAHASAPTAPAATPAPQPTAHPAGTGTGSVQPQAAGAPMVTPAVQPAPH